MSGGCVLFAHPLANFDMLRLVKAVIIITINLGNGIKFLLIAAAIFGLLLSMIAQFADGIQFWFE